MPKGAKYGGRQVGTPNKKTEEQINRAERILRLIETQYFEKDIKKITPAQRMILFSDMLEYVSPKLSRTDTHLRVSKIALDIVRNIPTATNGFTPSITENGNGQGEKV